MEHMTKHKTENLNVLAHEILPSPRAVKENFPATPEVATAVLEARRTVRNILERRDHRLLVVVGPCSIHDTGAAIEYARKLEELARETSESLYLVMRAYFEKPRTTVGWKGFINDPYLDDTFRIEEGIRRARKLLIDITRIGLPLSTEALDPIMPQYLHDLITWSAIGARTTESQTHREMASGLSSIVGVKNGTDGSLMVAVNALGSMTKPHPFSRHQSLRAGCGHPHARQRSGSHRSARRQRRHELRSRVGRRVRRSPTPGGPSGQHHGGLLPCQLQ